MSEEINAGAAIAGSSANANTAGPAEGNQSNAAGQPGSGANTGINLADYVPKKDYEELTRKLGDNSSELGGLRQFVKELEPLLDKLQTQPEIVEAIIEGKLTSDLVQAIMEGKVSTEDATKVAEAHSQVKTEMGAKKFSDASVEEIEKRIVDKLSKTLDDKVKESTAKLERSASDAEERHEFVDKTNTFIESVDDFQEYAEEVVKWLDEHPSIYDIQVAYDAVKGRSLAGKAKQEAENTAAEAQKDLAANAAGGHSMGRTVVADRNVVDQLISPIGNPNR